MYRVLSRIAPLALIACAHSEPAPVAGPPPAAAPAPSFDFDDGPVIRGALSKDEVRRVVRRHLPEVKYCYERALQTRSSLAGRVLIEFTIGDSGQVTASAVQSSTLKRAPHVEDCMASAVRRWEFPKPTIGVVRVAYPFELSRDKDD